MAEFTFSLDQLKGIGSSGASINASLYASTRNEDLTYTGNDTIVWDRINSERLRRGLNTLTDLGLPRPPEDTETEAPATNADGTAKTFAIKGPPGLTREQAFEIFKKQADTGGLVGFKPGEILSAATQAADGLPGAQAMLAQAQANLPKLGSLTGSAGALAGAGGALNGSLAQSAAGLTAAVGPAVSAISGALGGGSGITNSINSATAAIKGVAQAGSALVGASSLQGSTAVTSIQTINKAITSLPVSVPINTANFTKITAGLTSGSAVSPIGPMSVPEVNGVLAQAKNLVGQAANKLSNAKGLGEFGLNISQLETAGYVKPGTRALLESGTSLFNEIAKSPAVWTGKDGIKSAGDLLKNPSKQSQIQQDLMTKGVAGLAAVGVPVKNLSSQGLAGMALNAAKDLPSAEAFVKGLPIPGDATGSVQAAFGSAVRDGAFAVNLVNTKIPTVFKQQETPVPAADTVSRGTVDAASSRVIGNDKVPAPNYGPSEKAQNEDDVRSYVEKATILINQYINVAGRGFLAVRPKIEALANQQSITQQQYDAVNNEFQSVREAYNSKAPAFSSEVFAAYNRLSPSQQRAAEAGGEISTTRIRNSVRIIVEQSTQIKELLKQLSSKIEGQGISA